MVAGDKRDNRHLVIMAGGIGSRFWPLSTPDYPKQFIDILGCGKSLIQLTAERFAQIVPEKNIWIVTSEAFGKIVTEQLPNIPPTNILFEPCMRNTAPCIAYAAWKIKRVSPSADIIVTPADHYIADTEMYKSTILEALNFIEGDDAVLTIGITPRSPHTGYGYIATEKNYNPIKKVISFKEKPSVEKAEQYIREGNHYWNSGVFLWRLPVLQQAYYKYTPELANSFDKASNSFDTPQEKNAIAELYENTAKISVDYAIMEKADNLYVSKGDFGWSDVGTWDSLKELLRQDEHGNSCVGRAIFKNSSNCIAYIKAGKEKIIDGLHDAIIIDCGDETKVYDIEKN